MLSLLDEMKGTSGHYEYDAAMYGGFGYGAFGYGGYGGWGYDRWWGGLFYGRRVIVVPRSRGSWRHR